MGCYEIHQFKIVCKKALSKLLREQSGPLIDPVSSARAPQSWQGFLSSGLQQTTSSASRCWSSALTREALLRAREHEGQRAEAEEVDALHVGIPEAALPVAHARLVDGLGCGRASLRFCEH